MEIFLKNVMIEVDREFLENNISDISLTLLLYLVDFLDCSALKYLFFPTFLSFLKSYCFSTIYSQYLYLAKFYFVSLIFL